MDATPAGSSEGPQQPGQPVEGPSGAPSRRTLWIVVAVVGVLVVLAVIALLAVAFLDNNQDVTATVEKNLPRELQSNFAAQGLMVTVSGVQCDKIPNSQGAFTASCDIIITGLADPVKATITGSLNGKTVRVDNAQSDTTILNADLAVEAAQPAVDSYGLGIKVVSCTLPSDLVVVSDGLTFTCLTDSDETVTFEIQNRKVTITTVN